MNCPRCGASVQTNCPPPYVCGNCGWNSGYAPDGTALLPVLTVAPIVGGAAQ
jgi:hypothetical protein